MKKIFLKLNMAIIFLVVLFAGTMSNSYAKTIDYEEALSKIESEKAVSFRYESTFFDVKQKNIDVLVATYDEQKLQQIADEYDDISAIIIKDGSIQFMSDNTVANSITLSIAYADSDGNIQQQYNSERGSDFNLAGGNVSNEDGRITFAEAAWNHDNDIMNDKTTNSENIVIKYQDQQKKINKSSNLYITDADSKLFSSDKSESSLANFKGSNIDLTERQIKTIKQSKER